MRWRTILILSLSAPVLLSGLVSGFFLNEIEGDPQSYLLYEAINSVLLPLGCLIALHKIAGLSTRNYGLNGLHGFAEAMRNLPTLLLTILAFFSLVPAQIFAEAIFPPALDAFSYKNVIPDGIPRNVWLVYLAASAAVVEEIFYRGILKEAIIDKSAAPDHRWAYVFGSALLFGLNHWTQGTAQVVSSTYIGVVAALIYLRVNNIWYLILAHFAFNFWVASAW